MTSVCNHSSGKGEEHRATNWQQLLLQHCSSACCCVPVVMTVGCDKILKIGYEKCNRWGLRRLVAVIDAQSKAQG